MSLAELVFVLLYPLCVFTTVRWLIRCARLLDRKATGYGCRQLHRTGL